MAPSFKHRDGMVAYVDCNDWFDFRHKVQSYLVDYPKRDRLSGEYLFRGQSCSSWALTPSFDREFKNLSPVEANVRYEKMMAQFRKAFEAYGDLSARGLSYLEIDSESPDDAELEALAQHHGLPTRLLDWSHSLYVAAFFAFSKSAECNSGMVSVWAMSTEALKLFSDKDVSARFGSHRRNTRHLFQWGAFISNRTEERNKSGEPDLAQVFRSGSRWYNKKHITEYPNLIRFDIPAHQLDIAVDDLNSMRINSMTIFPGIDGIVQWIRTGGMMLR